ncbi:hypothetical protein HD597_012951 [Nonomuraea thailandensis]|uniref:Uncharacterized protein n=1 Tax=Nonomuraea thailandensis TaxID=1188745 RepID=A0A9X2GXT1_9ACTN|nr:hypothetical protein [Nonomuraea thailandensis]MCP2365847.1 hypothetical protein [Nonomuraea thailandensis]
MAGGDAERVVAKVLTLSHARIQAINPLAIRVLNLLACFAPDNLPCSVLDALPETDPLQVGEALALLACYNLITLTPSPADLQPGQPRTWSAEDLVSRRTWSACTGSSRPSPCTSSPPTSTTTAAKPLRS